MKTDRTEGPKGNIDLKSKYEMIAEFDSASWIDKKDLGDAQATEKGFIFKKK